MFDRVVYTTNESVGTEPVKRYDSACGIALLCPISFVLFVRFFLRFTTKAASRAREIRVFRCSNKDTCDSWRFCIPFVAPSPFLSPLRSVIEPPGRFQNVVGKESGKAERERAGVRPHLFLCLVCLKKLLNHLNRAKRIELFELLEPRRSRIELRLGAPYLFSFHVAPSLVSFTSKPRAASSSRILSLVAQSLLAFALARRSSTMSTTLPNDSSRSALPPVAS